VKSTSGLPENPTALAGTNMSTNMAGYSAVHAMRKGELSPGPLPSTGRSPQRYQVGRRTSSAPWDYPMRPATAISDAAATIVGARVVLGCLAPDGGAQPLGRVRSRTCRGTHRLGWLAATKVTVDEMGVDGRA
jgi:hypothetical protein